MSNSNEDQKPAVTAMPGLVPEGLEEGKGGGAGPVNEEKVPHLTLVVFNDGSIDMEVGPSSLQLYDGKPFFFPLATEIGLAVQDAILGVIARRNGLVDSGSAEVGGGAHVPNAS